MPLPMAPNTKGITKNPTSKQKSLPTPKHPKALKAEVLAPRGRLRPPGVDRSSRHWTALLSCVASGVPKAQTLKAIPTVGFFWGFKGFGSFRNLGVWLRL